jgi:ABC-type multidrug transport system fused ATPase/permease subunit
LIREEDEEKKPLLEKGKLIQDELRSFGSVKFQVYLSYFKASGGYLFILMFLFIFLFTRMSSLFQDIWIKIWANAFQNNPQVDTFYYLYVYILLNLLTITLMIIRYTIQLKGSLKASTYLHNSLLDRLFKAPIKFFDQTPNGRILNRLGKDLQSIDQELMNYIGDTLRNLLHTIIILIIVFSATPIILILIIPLAIGSILIANPYLHISRDLKRLDSITRSPIYSLFTETLLGVTIIRAFNKKDYFINEIFKRIDNNNRAFFYLWVSNRWLGIRIDLLGALIIFFSTLSIILLIFFKFDLDVGLVGLSLNYAIMFTDSLLWSVRMASLVEINLNSVERIEEYMNIEQEKPYIIENNRPNSTWPSKGEIIFDNLTLGYTENDKPIIKNLQLKINPGEKIGIVGKTGAGKSTLITALFRIIEPLKGTIYIDNIDITKIGLNDLRSKLMIIPQDPVLFEGTVRDNLDIYHQYDDIILNECLSRVGLIKPKNLKLEESHPRNVSIDNTFQEIKLHMNIKDQGKNLSAGQRQLLCFCRSIIKKSKILVLDEATSSVDH